MFTPFIHLEKVGFELYFQYKNSQVNVTDVQIRSLLSV